MVVLLLLLTLGIFESNKKNGGKDGEKERERERGREREREM